jgi:glycosyltransferase involved in cell wall biosynthesis
VHCPPDHAIFIAHKQQKLITTFHNYVLDKFMWDYSTWIQRIHYTTDLCYFTKRAIACSNVVTSVSAFTANLVKHELGCKQEIKIIYNGVDSDVFTPLKNTKNRKKIVVAFSGNQTIRKGANLLPQICEKLNENIELVCTAGLRNNSKLKSTGNLRFVDRVPNSRMKEFYNEADILFMPTVREGLSLAVLEAMSCGLPVVASNCSSLPELIIDGAGGYLCDIGDVDKFASQINSLAQDYATRKMMGEYNRERIIENFTLKRMVSNYRSLFEKVMDGNP